MTSPSKPAGLWLRVLLVLILCSVAGCNQKLKTGYGRSRGKNYTSSVNGTIVLNRMIKSSGRRVKHYRKLTPRWYDYDTIYWIPDDFSPPSRAAIDKAEQWLSSDTDKTLVFVARDYDASIVYWDHLRQGRPVGDRYARDYADALSRHIAAGVTTAEPDCLWYDWQVGPFQKATTVDGPLAEAIDGSAANIHYGSLPVPGAVVDSGSFNGYDAHVLLRVDSIPLVYSLSKPQWSGSRVIIVGNGSLFFNLPLTNPTNRKLSARLIESIDEIDYQWEDVLFVENQGSIQISDVDIPDDTSKWSWITKPPLRYMVPNLVFWCMLFCFVYFPIFGRPRNINRNSTSDFRDHIHALARLVAGTENRNQPRAWLDLYRKNSSRSQKSR